MNIGTGAISVVLVDDHALFREGVAELLASDRTFHVVAQGSDGTEALALVTEHRPDVVLVDVEMPGPGARATVSRLRQERPDTRVIVLTMHDKPELVRELLEQGAAAFLVKTITRLELIAAVRSVVTNQSNVLLSVSRRTINQLDNPPSNAALSTRELEVLRLAALAMSNAQIGKRLLITEGTVKRHLTNIYAKLGAVSRVDAIRKAIAARLIRSIDSREP
ncbi:MAG: response regulator transcription factor [Pseudonocardiales bacterium]|nr:response regulator transcription factor [Pseudonocardiales bacterium]